MKNNRVDDFIRNPKKALFTLALPTMVGMLVESLYNVVDTAFVGRLGADAIAALTFSFPLFIILIAINAGITTGMSSRISRFLGEKRQEDAENTAMHGLLLSIILAAVFLVIGLLTMRPLFALFGATASVIPLAISYFQIILIGIIFMFISFTADSIFTAQGDTRTPVIIQIISLVLNIILDYVFIYVLGYGVSGAAIATVIAFITATVLSFIWLRSRSLLRIRLSSFRFSKELLWEILRIGAPATLMIIIISFYVIFLNAFMAHFSTEHVASFGLVSRLETFATMPIFSFSIALMTLVGMFYGAKRYDLLKSIVVYGIGITMLMTSAVGVIFFAIPGLILRIFTSDPTLLSIGIRYMRVDVFTFPLMAVTMNSGRVMQGMGFGMPGLIINLTRILFVAVPLAYVFVYILGLGFIWIAYAMVIGGAVANIIALLWLRAKFRKLPENSHQ